MLQTPSGLNPGDPFRFVFVTVGVRDAASANIADYDSFVNVQAGGATYSGVPVDWLAIGSTASVDAIDHVVQATAPVYLSDGTLVTTTTTLAGLWSGALVHEINLDLAANPVQTFVWTGTNSFGTGFGGPLGASTPQVGSSIDSNGAWITSGRSNSGDFRPLYGISPVLTVPLAAVPEPSTLTMLGAALSVGLAIRSTRLRRAQQRRRPVGRQSWLKCGPCSRLARRLPMLRTIFFFGARYQRVPRGYCLLSTTPLFLRWEYFAAPAPLQSQFRMSGSSSQIAVTSSRPRRASIPSVRSATSVARGRGLEPGVANFLQLPLSQGRVCHQAVSNEINPQVEPQTS